MKSYAQASQDEWVQSIIGDKGWFVDVGAYDGVESSNTYALEKMGWRGLCIEPNREAFERLRANRDCLLSGYAISATDETLPFDGMSIGSGPPVDCRSLAHLLDVVGAPPVIDYLSIDVEGHELAVLAGMDFDRWSVRLITVEHNEYLEGPTRKMAILDFLTARGFECVALDIVAPGYGCYESWYQRVA